MRALLLLFSLLLVATVTLAEDHSDYFEGPFTSGPEVTAACLECHDVADGILSSRHWLWHGETFTHPEKGEMTFGKRDLINNFCIATESNWPRCTSCHIGYGWSDDSFDFEESGNIDCLVCHDGTGTYKKVPTGAGVPDPGVDLLAVAQSVGDAPSREACGRCHFDGGGGTGVKHGDLDDMLYEPTPELDVHMGGMDFTCVECHTSEDHHIAGTSHGSNLMEAAGVEVPTVACTDCHEPDLHDADVLNRHTSTLACETCHIPTYARGLPTKTFWDWSQAGEDREETVDDNGMPLYSKKKGVFTWGKDLVPTYAWFNGAADAYLPGDTIDPSLPVPLNQPLGSFDDPDARLAPFKVMRGRQPYDAVNNTMIVPHLFGPGGYWKTFDWNQAAVTGMNAAGLEYSGQIGWVETTMHWPLNHTVAPADDALGCTDCHIKGERLDWVALGYEGDPMKTKQRRLGRE